MFRVLATAITLSSAVALAQPAVPTTVRSVVSGGHWEHNGRAGTYRVVVTSEGWEHIWSRLFVEWIAIPPSREGEYTVVATVEPQLPFSQGTTLLDAKLRPLSVGRVEITVTGTPNTLAKGKAQVLLVASSPGTVNPAATQRKQ